MATLTVVIHDGEAQVVADGSAVSCKAATDLEKALGRVTKSVPTGDRVEPNRLVQK